MNEWINHIGVLELCIVVLLVSARRGTCSGRDTLSICFPGDLVQSAGWIEAIPLPLCLNKGRSFAVCPRGVNQSLPFPLLVTSVKSRRRMELPEGRYDIGTHVCNFLLIYHLVSTRGRSWTREDKSMMQETVEGMAEDNV